MVKQVTPQMTLCTLRIAFWVTKAEEIDCLLWYGNNGYTNLPQCYLYTYIVCFVSCLRVVSKSANSLLMSVRPHVPALLPFDGYS
jgi:hypothetical protein